MKPPIAIDNPGDVESEPQIGVANSQGRTESLVAIVGARAHRNLAQAWSFVRSLDPGVGVVSGAAEGVDTVAELAALQDGREVVVFPIRRWPGQTVAQFTAEAKARNYRVVDAGREVHAFTWGPSRGTRHAMRLGAQLGRPVREHAAAGPPRPLVFAAIGGGAASARFHPVDVRPGATGDWAVLCPTVALAEEALPTMAFVWRYLGELRVSLGIVPGSEAWGKLPAEALEASARAWEVGVRPDPAAWARIRSTSYVTLCSDDRTQLDALRTMVLPRTMGAVDAGLVTPPGG